MTDATETLTIDAFIKARLREDEGIAREAAEVDSEGPSWRIRKVQHNGMYVFGEGQIAPPGGKLGMAEDAQTIHVGRHDPERALREVARNRRVLERHRKFVPSDGVLLIGITGSGDICAGCGMSNGHRSWPCAEVRDLAAIWSSHPDFRAEWSA